AVVSSVRSGPPWGTPFCDGRSSGTGPGTGRSSSLGQRLLVCGVGPGQRLQLVAADRHVRRGLDAGAHLLASDGDPRDRDAVADGDLLVNLAADDQHVRTSLAPRDDRGAASGVMTPHGGRAGREPSVGWKGAVIRVRHRATARAG